MMVTFLLTPNGLMGRIKKLGPRAPAFPINGFLTLGFGTVFVLLHIAVLPRKTFPMPKFQ